MKRKDQMKVLLEVLNIIDQGNSAGEHCQTYYDHAMERLSSIIDQHPKDDPYSKICQWLWTDVSLKLQDFYEKA